MVNAEKVRTTGRKTTDKLYHRTTGYIGNLKSISLDKLLQQHPERVIQIAVKGMLPKNPLGRAMFSVEGLRRSRNTSMLPSSRNRWN